VGSLWERAANEMQELFKESLQELVDEGKKLNNQSMYFI
jgi:L-lysine 2,3-aminomutase